MKNTIPLYPLLVFAHLPLNDFKTFTVVTYPNLIIILSISTKGSIRSVPCYENVREKIRDSNRKIDTAKTEISPVCLNPVFRPS